MFSGVIWVFLFFSVLIASWASLPFEECRKERKKNNNSIINPPHDRAKQLLCVPSLNDPLSQDLEDSPPHPKKTLLNSFPLYFYIWKSCWQGTLRARKWAKDMQNKNISFLRSYAGDLFTLFLVAAINMTNSHCLELSPAVFIDKYCSIGFLAYNTSIRYLYV